MIAALAWGLIAGWVARAVVGGDKPGLALTLISGLAGYVVEFLLTHELLGLHAVHRSRRKGCFRPARRRAG